MAIYKIDFKRVTFVVIYHANVIRPVCNHLVGKHHTFAHRAFVGVLVMLAGVVVAKTLGHNENEIVAIVGDAIGYGTHGIGLIPFVEAIAKTYEAD